MRKATFNIESFLEAVYVVKGPKTTWCSVAEQCGIPRSTFSRMIEGKKPSADTLARLVHWSDIDIREHIDP